MTNKIKGGYKGRILRINLSTSEIENFPLDVDLAEKYIGGIGLNTYYLYHELNPHTEPLSPDNVLILGIGPLVGTGAPGSDRVELTGKSPLTNGFGSANAGVFLGIEFKQVGFDHIILKGKAPKPVYVWIHEQCVEIIEATHLWGKTTWETVSIIRHELRDEKVHVISIGPAGEKLVRFANVQNGFYSGFSRGGLGAIMGSKNLKAIAVRGTSKKVPIANVEKFTRATQEAFSRIKKDPFYSATVKYGSMAFAAGELVPNDKISAEYFYENLKEKTLGCYNCPMPCAHWVKIKKGPYKGTQLRGGEVAPLFAFSRACQIMDQEMVIKYSELCLKYGLDMISTAVTIGWAMDCYERGLIDKKDTGGFEIKKGDGEIVLDLINMIVSREGFGDILAEGSFRASELIGKETKEYLMGVKGMEIYSDPRLGLPGWAWCFSQAVSARGDPAKPHPLLDFPAAIPPKTYRKLLGMVRNKETLTKIIEWFAIPEEIKKKIFGEPPCLEWRTFKGKSMMTKWGEELSVVIDSLGICKRYSMDIFVAIGPKHYADMLSFATGLHITSESLMKTGERIINLQRLFNIREASISRKDDRFPLRIYRELLSGKFSYSEDEFERMLDEYYILRGWDINTGIPTEAKLEELNLTAESENL